MKVILFALAVFSAGVTAAPKNSEARFIDGIINDLINELRQIIINRGLDPFFLQQETYSYKLPVTDLLQADATVENLSLEGLSNIVVDSMDFSVDTNRLRFAISMPKIHANLGSAQAQAVLGNWPASGSALGSLIVTESYMNGDAHVNIDLINGISIDDVRIDFGISSIESELHAELLNREISGFLNNALGNEITNFLTEFKADVDTILGYYLKKIIDDLL